MGRLTIDKIGPPDSLFKSSLCVCVTKLCDMHGNVSFVAYKSSNMIAHVLISPPFSIYFFFVCVYLITFLNAFSLPPPFQRLFFISSTNHGPIH